MRTQTLWGSRMAVQSDQMKSDGMKAEGPKMRCVGVFLLLLGILGGFIVPFFGLFPFIAGCILACGCCGGSKGGCVKCISITGIRFAVIGLIVFIAIGAWLNRARRSAMSPRRPLRLAVACRMSRICPHDTTGQAAAAQSARCSLRWRSAQ